MIIQGDTPSTQLATKSIREEGTVRVGNPAVLKRHRQWSIAK